MKLAIDARWIRPEPSGIGTYTVRLVDELVPMATAHHSITLLFDDARTRSTTLARPGLASAIGRGRLDAAVLPFGPLSIRSQLRLPRILAQHRIDLLHSPNYMIPLFGGPPSIATLHDLIPLLLPVSGSRSARFLPVYARVLKRIARKAGRLIAVSETSARDARRLLDLGPDERRIRTVHGGVGAEFQPARRPDDDTRSERSILYVGRADPHKNLTGLLRAFARLRSSVPFAVELIVIGPEDERFPEPRALANELGLANAVDWKGDVDDQALVDAYQQADVLCLPSGYEGFGLPTLEAMACGTPVVCSNAGALPEIVGDAALLAPPDDPDAIADALARTLTETEETARRIARGRERAAHFTWAETARKTLQIYEELGEELSLPSTHS